MILICCNVSKSGFFLPMSMISGRFLNPFVGCAFILLYPANISASIRNAWVSLCLKNHKVSLCKVKLFSWIQNPLIHFFSITGCAEKIDSIFEMTTRKHHKRIPVKIALTNMLIFKLKIWFQPYLRMFCR